MFALALLSLSSSPDAEAPLLAKELGLTAFEAGQLLRTMLPSVLLKTEDSPRAAQLAAALTGRGHRAAVVDLAQVVPHAAMACPRAFRLEPQGLVGIGAGGEEGLAPYGQMRALIRATHVAEVDKVEVEKGRGIALGRAVLTGGLVVTKATEKEVRTHGVEKEPVLYLFPHAGTPWLLCESALKYDGLGATLRPSRMENFQTLVRRLREGAPQALYDERLLQFRGAKGAPNTPATLDLLAHLLARC